MIIATHGILASQIQSFVGLLDLYPNAAAAYSLRKLRSAYSGSSIQVRRSSDNTTQNIGFTITGDLDTSSLTSFCGTANGFITTWYDQSGNANNATQSTAANQPQIVSSGSVILQNSKPTLEFDGNSDFFNLTSNIATNVNYTGFQVVKRTATSTISITMAGTSINDSYLSWIFSDNEVYFRGSRGYVATTLNTSNRVLLTSLNIHTGNMTIYRDGSSIISNSPISVTGSSVMNAIGRRDTNYGIGNTQEIIVYSSDQSSNRTGIESNINTYYGIY